MLENFRKSDVTQNLRSVTMKGASLCHSVQIGGSWVDQSLTKPFAFDFGSMAHGWAKFAKGQRAEWDMRPASERLDDDVREGWIAAATCTIASAEIGGLKQLQCTDRDRQLAAAIMDLHGRYLTFSNASQDKIPVVRFVVDQVTADISLEIVGWTPRTAAFGVRVNPVPPTANDASMDAGEQTSSNAPAFTARRTNGAATLINSKIDQEVLNAIRQRTEAAKGNKLNSQSVI